MRKCILWFALAAVALVGPVGCGGSKDEPGSATAVSLTLSRTSVPADGSTVWATVATADNASWKIELANPDTTIDWGATVNPQTGTGPTNLVQINYLANVASAARSMNVVLTSMGTTVSKTLTQAGTGPDVIPDQDKLTGWKELPSSDLSQTTITDPATNTMFNTHFTVINGSVLRNFSMLYDKKEKMAYWVAYPMASVYTTGSAGRAKNFIFDPNVPQAYQLDLTYTYTEYYTTPSLNRGHQIPSQDRQSDAATNQQTFYFTNMTPQIGSFNSGLWSSLEGMVRSNVPSGDTLYVVTGAVLHTVGGTETVSYAHNRAGDTAAIPNYYFKCLVKRSGDTYTAGIAFWIPHTTTVVGTKFQAYVTTIRDVETKTGFNFFGNLTTAEQNTVETSYKTSDWSGM